MIRLHCGCGGDLKKGYINIDAQLPCDLQHDFRNPLPYLDNSVDEIWANGVIQHFSKVEWKVIKKDWVRVLKSDGVLHLGCWDFPWVLCMFLLHPDQPYALQRVYGGQDGEFDYFKNGFTYERLCAELEEEGVTDFERLPCGEEFIDMICKKI